MATDAGLTGGPPRLGSLAWMSALDRLVLAEIRLLDRPARPVRQPAPAPEPETEAGSTGDGLLQPEEEAFVASTGAWLAGRPNADMLIDAIWSRAQAKAPDPDAPTDPLGPGEPPPEPAP